MPLITSTITPWPPPHLKKQSLHNTPDTPQITADTTRWCSKFKKKRNQHYHGHSFLLLLSLCQNACRSSGRQLYTVVVTIIYYLLFCSGSKPNHINPSRLQCRIRTGLTDLFCCSNGSARVDCFKKHQ